MSKGIILVLSGPSGCGKGTVLKEVLAGREDVFFSVSATTRAPREGEVDGVHYHFLTNEAFEGMIARGELLEHAGYCDHYYGTPAAPVDCHVAEGDLVILEIDVKGQRQIKDCRPEAVSVFIAPPSMEELGRRLRARGTETEEVIQKRLAQAKDELQCVQEYDYCIVNHTVQQAAEDLKAILRAEACRTNH